MGGGNAAAWGVPNVLDFFRTARSSSDQIYRSEWFFLGPALVEGLSVLDVGCAQGGFASILSEHLQDFTYTGLDINAEMIAKARERHPDGRFIEIAEGTDWEVLGDERFDLVLVLGILHLHEGWRDTLARAWRRTAGLLIFDLREIDGPSIEDKETSFFRMDFGGGHDDASLSRLPYNLINAGEALGEVRRLCPGARSISQFGYVHPLSASATSPVADAMANVWRIERG